MERLPEEAFISVVDSQPPRELPGNAKECRLLFLKGIIIGFGITLCLGGIFQYVITNSDENSAVHTLITYLWFGINVWSWVIGLLVLSYIAYRLSKRGIK